MMTPDTDINHEEIVNRLSDLVNDRLESLVEARHPVTLYDPARYVLAGRGKRIRPVLLLLVSEALGVQRKIAMPAALAVEIFHNFTLVHDDIMDNAGERRGRPTVHVKWDENTAILCGDYLMALAYEQLAQSDSVRLVRLMRAFNTMVVRLCEGQASDKEFERRSDVSVMDYLGMIERKTAALLELTFTLPGILAGVEESMYQSLQEIGRSVGIAFQIQDDLLDLTAEDARWGKAVGGDLVEGKKTFILLRALELAEEHDLAWLRRIPEQGGITPDEVPEARRRISDTGALIEAQNLMVEYYESAFAQLDRWPDSGAKATVQWMINQIRSRVR